MIFDSRPSPARVSVAAAAMLPRWALWSLLLAYAVAGITGRDPWYHDDAASFGVMWTMAHGSALDWWLPNVVGAAFAEEGPLSFWVGAASIWLFGPLIGDAQAARLTCVLWFLLMAAGLWYATWRLARRDEAQPIAFAFGGEATPRDYGRMLADIALLLLIGTVGIVIRAHETTAETAAVAWVSVALFGLALSLDRFASGALACGFALGALALTRGPAPAAFLLIGVCVAGGILLRANRRWEFAAIVSAIACALFAVWPIVAYALDATAADYYFAAWRDWAGESVRFPSAAHLGWVVRNVFWYTWPLWPLAAWTMWSWRQALRAPHIAVASVPTILLFIALLTSNAANEASLILTVPPLVILAAFGATTLRRAAESVLDWFAIVAFSFLALAVWAYYVAVMTGAPPKMAASIARLTPGFVPPLIAPALLIATVVTIAWLALVTWRVRINPPMLWRGPILAAGGLAMLWIVLAALFMPSVNYNRSYAPLAIEVARRIAALDGADACVLAHRLRSSHRAVFAFHGGLRFAAERDNADCGFALHRDTRRSQLDDDPPPGSWQLVWRGGLPTRPDETFRIYRRARQ